MGGKNIDEKELSDTIKKLHDINKYMSETINDFTDFFALDKKKVQFKLIDQINSTINIINGSLNTHNIKLDIYIKKNPTLYGYKNEYSQVLINILANARDVLIQKKIENPYIKIEVFEEDNNIITTI